MVGQQPLKLFILVRVQVPEPRKSRRITTVFALKRLCEPKTFFSSEAPHATALRGAAV